MLKRTSELLINVENGIAILTMNRENRLNALGIEMGEKIIEWTKNVPSNVRCVVITGSGDKAFSTGRDLKDSKLHTKEMATKYMGLARDSVYAWTKLGIPSIAAINGHAFGWGLELALACDLRVASETGTLCFPECRLGIFPGALGTVLLPRIAGPSVAKDLIFTSRPFDGNEALRLGIVNRVATNSQHCKSTALEIAQQIASNGPLGVAGAKKVIDQGHDKTWEEQYRFSDSLRLPLNDTDDFREALQAFEEKRKPVFHGT